MLYGLWPPYLCLFLNSIHLIDELAVGLEEQQQLEVQFVKPSAHLKLLDNMEELQDVILV